MQAERFEIPVEHPSISAVSAIWQYPEGEKRRSALLLGHGAGAPMDGAFLEYVAPALVARGFAVMRFAYPYAERMRSEGRRLPPDRAPALESTHERALERFLELAGGSRAILGGKSLGGRIASHLVARGADCSGLVFFGYPLHPAKKPEKLRSEHFPSLCQPALFLQGERDALGTPEHLEAELRTYGGVSRVVVVEQGDHDFRVPKRTGRSRGDVLEFLVDTFDRWERETFPD